MAKQLIPFKTLTVRLSNEEIEEWREAKDLRDLISERMANLVRQDLERNSIISKENNERS